MKLLLSLLGFICAFINFFFWYYSNDNAINNLIISIVGLIVTIWFVFTVSSEDFKGK